MRYGLVPMSARRRGARRGRLQATCQQQPCHSARVALGSCIGGHAVVEASSYNYGSIRQMTQAEAPARGSLVGASALRVFGTAILSAAGLSSRDAETIADALVEANLRGVDGHGVLRLIQYVDSIRQGGINPRPNVRVVRRQGAVALVDADGGYGFGPSYLAMDTAVEIADELGIGAAGVCNSHHFGIAVLYALRAAEVGAIGIATTNTTAVMPAPGGLQSVVGNNPLAIAVPRPGALPIAADVAMSEVSWGKISLAASNGSSIPEGWALDEHGAATTDPTAALRSNMLVPMGGHKGFALAVLFELLAGALTGSPVGTDADGHFKPEGGCGHFMIAIRPGFFGDIAAFDARVEQLVVALRSAPRVPGSRKELPGEFGGTERKARLEQGVPISGELLTQLNTLASELGVAQL
jgi:LDH2 family malate/lactate/ureidoglycolate dehydrogenase